MTRRVQRFLIVAAVAVLSSTAVQATAFRHQGEMMGVDWNTVQPGDVITVTGTIGVYGNEPHTYLALAVPDDSKAGRTRLVALEGEFEQELAEMQNRTVTVTGVLSRLEIGPGTPATLEVSSYEESEP